MLTEIVDGVEKCVSNIKTKDEFDNTNFWLMGTPFYRTFEVGHDLTENKIGFRPISTSTVNGVARVVAAAFSNHIKYTLITSLLMLSQLYI